MVTSVLQILIFPGFIFLLVFGMTAEYVDRIMYARLQNRKGPPWFQPWADFLKLLAKEDLVPDCADEEAFRLMPILALASVITASIYIPIWGSQALFSFSGDLIVILYLLTIPTFTFFLGGWYSRSIYSLVGAVRTLTQLFGYEIPLFMAILAAAMLADDWSLSKVVLFYGTHPLFVLFNLPGFVVALVCLLGKLEKTPFDIPDAETEIVAGPFTEYSGRCLAFFRMALDIELVVGAMLLSAVFLPFGMNLGAGIGFVLYILKSLLIICLLAVARTVVARLRIDQMISFCWTYLAPVAFLQIVLNLFIKGFLPK
ncbi:MAG: NADH-quinone oxidoreductase subunit H [Candidatus Wallbacteria bacterium]|nr:NADH-quinone oxidoreductase subunit H [Candidatus Wallbacteria bacterium]